MALAEIGSYYISLVPTAHDITGHIRKTMAPAIPAAADAGRESGGRFSGAFGNAIGGVGHALASALKVGTAAAGAAVVAAGAVGVKTAAQLETAQISFTTMLGSAQKAQSFLGDLRDFAAKTPFDLPGLQTSAKSLISIGIGTEKILPIMTTLGNVTSGMGTGSEGIKRATVALQQMNAAQKISAEDLNQLRDAGIPVYELLTAATGKSTAQIAEMRDKGQLGREELEALMTALETGRGFERFNGLMEAQSASITGLWSTLKDTFGVGMADIIEPLVPMIKSGLGGAISFLSDTVIPRGTAGMSSFTTGLAAFGAAWVANDGVITSSGFPGFMERVAFGLRGAWTWLTQLDFSSMQAFLTSLNFPALAPAFDSIGSSLVALVPAAGEFVTNLAAMTPDVLAGGINLLAGALGWLAGHTDWIVANMPLIVGGFIAWKVAAMGVNLVTAASVPLMVAANVARTVAAVAEYRLVTAQYAAVTAGAAVNTQQQLGLLATTRSTAASVAHNVAVLASATGARIAAGAQWLWNAAMSASPIALVIKGVALLAAGFIWFFTQTDIGRQIIAGAWATIQAVVGGVVGWFTGVAMPAIGSFFGGIGDAAGGANVASTGAFGGIQQFIGGVVAWFRDVALPIAGAFFGGLASFAVGAFTGIAAIVTGVWAVLSGIWAAWSFVFTEVLFPVVRALWQDVVVPAFQIMGEIIRVFWSLASGIFQILVSVIQNILMPVFLALWKTTVAPVFEGIAAVIGWMWNNIVGPIFGAIIGFIVSQLSPPFWTFLSIVTAVWEGVSSVVGGAWNGIRDGIFGPMGDFLTKDLPGFWEVAKTLIGAAWDGVLAVAKKPVTFVIDQVINDGIIGTFNAIADKLPGVNKIDRIQKPAGWARGGVLPGYQPRKVDDTFYPMRSGEGVLVPEAVRGIGPSTVHALNAAGNNGGVAAVRAMVASQGFAKGGLIRPAAGPITSGYRGPGRPDHDGVDIGAPMGAPVVAAGDGRIVDAGWHNWGGGNHVDLQHAGNLRTEYYHLSQIVAQVGQQVKKGDVIGRVGSTGNSTGPHLHYEVHIGDGLHSSDGVNPMPWLDGGGEFDPEGGMAGGGGGGGWNPFTAVIDGIKGLVSGAFPGGGQMVDVAVGTGMKIGSEVVNWVTSKFTGVFDSVSNAVGTVIDSAQVTAWATEALVRTGHFDPWNLGSLLRRITQESNGDPRAVNNWDSNAAAGIPSKGIMQTIEPTFRAFRDKDLPNDIFDPVANIVAAIHYTKAKYGSLREGWDRPGGYALGGIIPTLFDDGGLLFDTGGPQVIDHQRRRPDKVLTDAQWDAMYGIADDAGSGGDIYVQNPFTGDYLIAETERYAVDATGQAMKGSLVKAGRGGKYRTGRR